LACGCRVFFEEGACLSLCHPQDTAIRPVPTCNSVKSACVRCRAPKHGRMADSVEETEQFCSDSPRPPAYDCRGRSRGSLSVRRSKGAGHHSLETERRYLIVICLPAVGAWAASDRPAEAIHRLGRPHRSRGNPGQIAQACRGRRYRLKLAPERSSPSLLSTLMGLIRTSAPAIAQRSARTARRASMAADAAAVVDG
jgi:hypothetical protein